MRQLPIWPAQLFPGILKTARLGYDGKGQIRVSTRAELAAAWDALKNVACVLEKMLPLAAECSVIVARGWSGEMVHFPPQLNLHRDGILAVTQVFEGNMPLPSVERSIAATEHGSLATVIVKERVNRLLKHSLFVANDHFRRVQVDKLAKPIVPINDSTIKVVQVTRRKVAGIK